MPALREREDKLKSTKKPLIDKNYIMKSNCFESLNICFKFSEI